MRSIAATTLVLLLAWVGLRGYASPQAQLALATLWSFCAAAGR